MKHISQGSCGTPKNLLFHREAKKSKNAYKKRKNENFETDDDYSRFIVLGRSLMKKNPESLKGCPQ